MLQTEVIQEHCSVSRRPRLAALPVPGVPELLAAAKNDARPVVAGTHLRT